MGRAPASQAPAEVLPEIRWWAARAWQTNLALLFFGVLLFLLSRHLVFEYDDYTIGFSGTSGWSIWCYAMASLVVLVRPVNRYTFPIILGVAVVCRLPPLFGDAFLSSDIYRYIWDGIVQHAGINPYLYVPADAHLEFLRGASEGNIYPAINRATYAHTIYPPFAQSLFWIITLVSPTLACMKTAMVLCEGITLWSLVWMLRRLGRPREQAILYAWCPLLIWEIAGSGHLDSVAMALIGCTLVARYLRRPGLTGLLLGLAVITKLYPLTLFPALYMRAPAGRPRDWKMPAAMIATIILGYACYASAGRLVFGFLGGYVAEEGLATGVRYFLLELAQTTPGLRWVSTPIFLFFAAAVFSAISFWAWRTASPVNREASGDGLPLAPHQAAAFLPPTFALAGALMLLFSPHYAWYIAWLVPFLTLLPSVPAFAYIMGFFYLYTTALAAPGPRMFLANKILYGLVLLAASMQFALRRWIGSLPGSSASQNPHDVSAVLQRS